jgi:hypothetical protein
MSRDDPDRRRRLRELGGGFKLSVALYLIGAVPGFVWMFKTILESTGEPTFSPSQIALLLGGPALGWFIGNSLTISLGRRREAAAEDEGS